MPVNFIGGQREIASGRYRTLMPANWLYANGFTPGTEVLVIGKHNWPEGIEKGYKSTIFDVCDDHFDGKWRNHYLKWCNEADSVVCNSEEMRRIILERTGRAATVIPDPVEGQRMAPHLNEKLLWFGNKWNFKAVQRVIPSLEGYELEVVSEPFDDKVTPWSPENMRIALDRAGIVIIPASKGTAKSGNRLITALQAGCFVVAEDLPAYREFDAYAWIGNIREGYDWALSNRDTALKMIYKGQDFIQNNFSMNKIGPMWARVINDLS